MDHPLLMDDFDEDLATSSNKSISEEDLIFKDNGGKKLGLESRKISELSSSGEEEQELSSLEHHFGESDQNMNSKNNSSSPIEIKGSPARRLESKGSLASPRSGSSVESAPSNSRLSIFRVLTRRSSNQGKHKKLQDNWIQAREPVLDGVTFCVKFLGSTLIDKTGAADAAEATKTVIQMVKAGQKTGRVGLKVSANGITLLEPNSGDTRLEISIYDIAHCSTDSNFPNVFSFIATNKNDVNECYCFAARKRKMAQQITLTIAQSFNLAFEIWQNSSLDKDHHFERAADDVKVIIGSTGSAQSCSSSGSSSSNPTNHNNHNHPGLDDIRTGQWVHFDEVDEQITEAINSFNMVTLTPFRPENDSSSSSTKSSSSDRTQQSNFSENEDLLICLN